MIIQILTFCCKHFLYKMCWCELAILFGKCIKSRQPRLNSTLPALLAKATASNTGWRIYIFAKSYHFPINMYGHNILFLRILYLQWQEHELCMQIQFGINWENIENVASNNTKQTLLGNNLSLGTRNSIVFFIFLSNLWWWNVGLVFVFVVSINDSSSANRKAFDAQNKRELGWWNIWYCLSSKLSFLQSANLFLCWKCADFGVIIAKSLKVTKICINLQIKPKLHQMWNSIQNWKKTFHITSINSHLLGIGSFTCHSIKFTTTI